MSKEPPGSAKLRLDQLLVEKGLAASRERAKALIMAGQVIVNDHAITKSGQKVSADSELRLKGQDCPYVSRGGLKLAGSLDHFNVDPAGWTCLDIGASTGGFTDCLLQRGAKKVFTIDVGTNQLAWSLRNDPRVICREKFHVKELTSQTVENERIDLIVIDVSFISLTTALLPALPFLANGSRLLAMIKPQFEAGRDKVGKGGVVRDEADQLEAVKKVVEFLSENGYKPLGPVPSDIKGPKGNQEYFIYFDSYVGENK